VRRAEVVTASLFQIPGSPDPQIPDALDSLTQAVLGAVVGEAVLGKKVGNRALAWGAAAGTLPDLDILAYPLLDPAAELLFHRGPTHGLVFAPVVGPLLGLAVYGLYRRRARRRGEPDTGNDAAGWRGWGWLFFWCLLTHPLLDAFTVYGTQLLSPFSNRPFALPALFIIDPGYTLPLLAALVVVLWSRRRGTLTAKRRRWALALGIGLSTAHIGGGLVFKSIAEREARATLGERGTQYERLLSTPGPLTTLLWTAYADAGDTVHVVTKSVLDGQPARLVASLPKRADLLAPVAGTRAAETLAWFHRGYFSATPAPPGDSALVYLRDLRFGRSDAWLTGDAPFIFTFALLPDPQAEDGVTFRQVEPEVRFEDDTFGRLFDRIVGNREATPSASEGRRRP
jgi:inner membrane protein